MGLTHRELVLNATPGVTEALIEGIVKTASRGLSCRLGGLRADGRGEDLYTCQRLPFPHRPSSCILWFPLNVFFEGRRGLRSAKTPHFSE